MTVKPAGIGKVIFEGEDLRLVINDLGSDAVLLTYTARPEKGRPQGSFAKPFADKRGISGIYIVSKWAHWWQTPEMPIVEALIRDSGLIDNAPHSLAYGGSMGGFGVLLSAGRLGCKYGLVSGPQITFAPEIVDYPNRYAPDTDPLTFVEPDARAGISPHCRYVVLYDPLDSFDRRQVSLLESFPSVDYLPVPLSSHSPLKLLNEAGVLEDLVVDSLRGTADIKSLRRHLRTAKRDCPLYLATLGTIARRRNHPPVELWAARRAHEIEPLSVPVFQRLARILRETRNFAELETAARAFMATEPEDGAGTENLLIALYSQMKLEEAAQFGRPLCERNPERYELWKWLFAALTRLHRFSEIADDCRRHFDSFNGDMGFLRNCAEALIATGRRDESEQLIARMSDHRDFNGEDRELIEKLRAVA